MSNLNSDKFYNPSLQDTIAFYDQSSYSATSTGHGGALLSVDLYYQPLLNPVLLVAYSIISIILLCIGEYVNNKVLKFLSRQESVVKEILQAFTYIQMVYWPVSVLFQTSNEFIYPLREVVGDWYCIVGQFWVSYGAIVILFHSLIVGLTRYVFVVHNERVLKLGKERTKKIAFWLSILMPLVATIWSLFNRRDTSPVASFNKCKGIHHNVFLIENSIGSTAKRTFCLFENYNDDEYNVSPILMKLSCTLFSVVFFTMNSNIIEGLLYWRTVRHANR